MLYQTFFKHKHFWCVLFFAPILLLFGAFQHPAFGQDSAGIHSLSILRMPDQAWDVVVVGTYAYVACDDSGLTIVNITDVCSPFRTARVALPGWAQKIVVQNNIAYLACRTGGLQIVNVSNPYSPVLIGSYTFPGINVRGLFLRDTIVYLAADELGLISVSVNTPSQPRYIGNTSTGVAYRVIVRDTLAYVAANVSGFRVVNVRNPAHMTIIGTYNPFNNISFRSIALIDNMVFCGNYLTDGSRNGICAMNVSNPTAPSLLHFDTLDLEAKSHDTTGPFGLCLSGRRLIATHKPCIRVFDIDQPEGLVRVRQYFPNANTENYGEFIWNAFAEGMNLYLAGDYGLRICSFDGADMNSSPVFSVPENCTLKQNFPNPFNAKTEISYSIPAAGEVTLTVFDPMGRKVTTLVNGYQYPNHYRVQFDASGCATGVYFYRLQSNRFSTMRKMVFVK